MNHKALAGVALVVYWLSMMLVTNTFPKKCIEHVTPEERLKSAKIAPFSSAFGVAMSFVMAWAVFTLMFQ